MWKSAHPYILDLVAYEPGKPVEELARETGLPPDRILKLASNENPLGPSPKALQAMRKALEYSHFYPDGGGYFLREAIAEKHGLTRDHVILGNGSNEIIEFTGHTFLRPSDEVITAQHTFSVYSLIAQLFGAKTIKVPDVNNSHDLMGMLEAITPHTRQIFIANPNNPTGTFLSQEQIDSFMKQVPDDVLVIFDEAYYEFPDCPTDSLRYVREGRNVVIMRTFSKAHGLANLRIGYGLAPTGLAQTLQKTRQPFNVNGIAQAGALAALQDENHIQATREMVRAGRLYLQKQFAMLNIAYVPSQANFVLTRTGDGDATFRALLQSGIIVRAMRNYELPEWIRVSVGTPDQNQRLIAALKRILPATQHYSRNPIK